MVRGDADGWWLVVAGVWLRVGGTWEAGVWLRVGDTWEAGFDGSGLGVVGVMVEVDDGDCSGGVGGVDGVVLMVGCSGRSRK